MKDYKRILIIYTAFFGDIILATALLRETRKLFPNAMIDFVTTPATYDLVRNNPHINEIMLFDKHNHKLRNFFGLLPKLIFKRYELALSPHSHFTTNFLMFFSFIPHRLGFDRYRSRFLLNMKVDYPKSGHVSARILHLLSLLTDEKLDNQTELFLSEADEKSVMPYLENDKKPVLIAPGSVWATKRWHKDSFGSLSKLLETKGFRLIFIGSNQDKTLAAEIIKTAGLRAENSCGDLKITESAALIKNAKLLICNDSAPLHLANAVNTPVYAFFGPTVKRFGYYPYRENDRILEIELDCRPCGMHGSHKCPLGHHNCMNLIKPETVFKLICEHFQD